MAISVQCKSCGGQFRARNKDRGKTVACTRCGVELLIDGKAVPDFDVFVSHSTKDKQTADAIVATLEAAKIRCWVAPRDIAPGANWGASIVDAIGNSRIMVMVYSANSNASQQVVREVERAVAKGLVILPVRIDQTPMSKDIEYFISTRHWLDALTPPLEKHLGFLVKTTRAILDGEDAPRRSSAPGASISRGKRKTALLLAVLAVILMMSAVVAIRPLRERIMGLVGALQSPSYGVHDEGHFFSTDAVAQADKVMAQISAAHNREIWIETVLFIPVDRKAEFAAEGKDRFFENWGLQVSKKHSAGAVIIFVCKDPGYLQVMAFGKSREKEFTQEDRRALSAEMLAAFTNKEFDRGLLEGIRLMQSRMDRNTGIHPPLPAPATPPPSPAIAKAPEKPVVPVTTQHPVAALPPAAPHIAPAPPAAPSVAPPSPAFVAAIQPGVILAGEGRKLTIVERSGDSFRGTFESGEGKFVRDVKGTIKDDRFYWLARDASGVKGGAGGDNFGTIQGDEIHFVWHQNDAAAASGSFVLRYAGKSPVVAVVTTAPATPIVLLPEGVLKPGTEKPASAITLFDGTSAAKWLPEWPVKDGAMTSEKADTCTKDTFTNYQLHLEFNEPHLGSQFKGQNRGNSGVFQQGRYELQILDSYNNDTYADGACAAVYGIQAPLKNVAKPPGEWQTYDITFHAARYDAVGKKIGNARITVYWNGELVQDNTEIPHCTIGAAGEERAPGPIRLQYHKHEVQFRNIWIVPLAPNRAVAEGIAPSGVGAPASPAPSANLPAPVTPAISTKPPSGAFTSLFNGKNLSGWTVDGGYEKKWTVEDGVIVARGDTYRTGNYLLTEREYANFILRLEFRLDKNAGSAIALRAIAGENVPYEDGHRRFDHPIFKLKDVAGQEATGTTHWLFDKMNVGPDRAAEMRPTGSWNRLEIELNGHSLRATVNGKEISNRTLDPHALFSDGTVPGLNRVKGHIGLQKHGGIVRFRNVEISELP
jgi:uncharacterized membrane protein YgcG